MSQIKKNPMHVILLTIAYASIRIYVNLYSNNHWEYILWIYQKVQHTLQNVSVNYRLKIDNT